MTPRVSLTFRPVRLEPSDYAAVAEIINAAYSALHNDRRISVAATEAMFNTPVAPENPVKAIILEANGQIVGYGKFNVESKVWAQGSIHPDRWGQGFGQQLLDWIDADILETASSVLPPESPITVNRGTGTQNKRAVALFARNGYQQVRSFYEMRIDLATVAPASPLPDGLRFEPFDRERHGYKLYEADQDAFADSWGYERETWEEFQHTLMDGPNTDPSLWLIAWDGDEIAGYSLARHFREGDPTFAWINQFGVLKRWRRRGVGAALLKNSFALFKQRGFTIAGLGVDSENQSNAVALYERVGMQVNPSASSLVFEKRLR